MKHPELIENLGKIHPKKNRGHDYGRFQCPFCPTKFTAQISKVVNEHTTSCGCRKKKNFVEHAERRVKAKVTTPALGRLFGERCQGTGKAYLIKKYGLRPSEYPTALRLAQEAYLQPVPPPTPEVSVQKPAQEVSREAAATPPPTPSKQALVEPTSKEMIETMRELSLLTADIKQELRKNIHYEENDEGYKIAHSIKFDKVPMPSSVAADVKRELIEKGVLTAQCLLVNGWREVLN